MFRANLYYKFVADEDGQLTKLSIYGLNRGETADMSGEYPFSVTRLGRSNQD